MGSLLHCSSVHSISLLKDLLRRAPLLDEAGDPRLRTRLLGRFAQAVEDVAGGEGAQGDIETALYGASTSRLAPDTLGDQEIGIASGGVGLQLEGVEGDRRRTPKLSFTGSA